MSAVVRPRLALDFPSSCGLFCCAAKAVLYGAGAELSKRPVIANAAKVFMILPPLMVSLSIVYSTSTDSFTDGGKALRRSTMRTWSKLAIAARAAEVTVMCSNAFKEVFLELAPQFERTTGNKISVTYDSTTNFQNQIKNGAKPDLVVATDEAIDTLIKQGKLVVESYVTEILF